MNAFADTVNVSFGSVVISCYKCSLDFGVSQRYYEDRKQRQDNFWCPNGHRQHFIEGKTEAQKLRDELEQEKRRVAYLREDRDRVAGERDHADRRRAAVQGVVTKLKKRVGKGVCPCCNRFFTKLHDHMKTRHPEYADAGANDAKPQG